MSDENGREVACRLIGRDQAIRQSGKTPAWGSVRQILDFVCQRQLLSDPMIAPWLCTLAGSADIWFSKRVLDVISELLGKGFPDQAHVLYRLVLGLDDDSRWATVAPALVSNSLLTEMGIDPILGRAGLLVHHPCSWGQTACELLNRVLREHQKKEQALNLSVREMYAEKSGEPFNVDQHSPPREDDGHIFWYFAMDRHYAPRACLAAAVDRGVRQAAQNSEADTFHLFAGMLLSSPFAVGTGILLASLLDGLTGNLVGQPWHTAEAARLLALDQVQRPPSLHEFRRLLRRALLRPEYAVAVDLTEVIRRSNLPVSARLRELADVASWETLTPEEHLQLADQSERNGLAPPCDPRTEAVVRRAEPHSRSCRIGGHDAWPYPEDNWAIEELLEIHGNQDQATGQTRLDRRLDALQMLLGRAARDSQGWLGEILGWCQHSISLLRQAELIRLGRDIDADSLSSSEWEALLEARARWWRERADAALRALASMVPTSHRERRPGGLSWSTSDPLKQSLTFLDTVLSVNGEGPFAALRLQLERVIDEAWPCWPPFTRATALSVLRPWYWHVLGKLRNRLAELVTQDSDPLSLYYALERYLIIGGPNFGANLGRFLARAPDIESSGDMVNRLAQVMGHAFLRRQGQANPGEGLRQLAELYQQVQQALPEHQPTREQIIKGFLFGALNLFNDEVYRTQLRADTWISVVVWARSVWHWTIDANETGDRFPLLPVTAVLAQAWPAGVRQRMLAKLQKLFLRILEDGSIADFCWLHHELTSLLCGDGQGSKLEVVALDRGDFSDENLLELCRASAERVASWRRSGASTKDLAWGGAPTGRDTADLIRAVVRAGSDRTYLRRELPPIIDRLAEFGAFGIATELRLVVRRG